MTTTTKEIDVGGEEVVTGTVTTPNTIVTGASGKTYRMVDFFQMKGGHEKAIMRALLPVIPALATGDMVVILDAVMRDALHRQLAAMILLPTEDQQYRAEELATRQEDIDEAMTVEECVRLLESFYDGASISFRAIFKGYFKDDDSSAESSTAKPTSSPNGKQKKS